MLDIDRSEPNPEFERIDGELEGEIKAFKKYFIKMKRQLKYST